MADIVGLTLAVFNEVFEICMFITQTISDAAHHDKNFSKLESDFTHQQNILGTFGRRFIENKIIYDLDECLVVDINRYLQELKKVVGEYARLAAKYNDNYKKVIKNMTEWWKVGITQPQKKIDREGLQLDVVNIREPATPSRSSLGFRNRLSWKRAQLEWALFDQKKLEELVNEQKSWTKKLIRVIKLSLLYNERLSNNVGQLQELSKDAKAFGFSKLTSIRILIVDPSQGSQAIEIDTKRITISSSPSQPTKQRSAKPTETLLLNASLDGSEILIEYKKYVRDEPEMLPEITAERIRFLSKLLGVIGDQDDDPTFTLHCLGYFHEPAKSRFGLAFSVPQGYDKTPLSLHSSITTLIRDTRPTLGQRFGMAYGIGYALMEWFLVDWVHKSISSQNIFLFRKAGEESLDFSSPYLGGFEYARPLQEVSNEASNHVDFKTNIYRHPARQGLPSEGFKKTHDIYAFGVLLLEIGLWTVASSRELFKDENYSPEAIKDTLIKNARARLGHFMGQKYRDAVLCCLEGTLKVEDDDEKQTKMISAFKEKVLDVCEEGRALL